VPRNLPLLFHLSFGVGTASPLEATDQTDCVSPSSDNWNNNSIPLKRCFLGGKCLDASIFKWNKSILHAWEHFLNSSFNFPINIQSPATIISDSVNLIIWHQNLNESYIRRPLNGHHLYLTFVVLSITLCDMYT
jgi:hypothetical protein